VFSVAKIGGLAALVLLRLTLFRRPEIAAANFANFWGTGDWSLAVLPVIGAAMVGSLFSSDAWNNVTFAAAEVRDPTRNLPRALAIGTGLVSALYILANVAYLNILPFYGDPNGADVLSRGLQYASQDRVGTAAIEVALGTGAAAIMAVAILLSTFGCNNGLILAGPRVYYAMARDNLFFERAGTLHPTYRTPVFGLVAQAIWTSILCLSGTYSELLNYVVFAALIFYLLTTVSLFRLRRLRPDLPRPVKAFGYPILPALYIVAIAFLLVVLLADPQQRKFSALGLLIVALGVPVYAIWRRSR
jgi:APA family basic amino acid/polyamine antiporter